jgi:CRISPR-associated protein Csc1
MAGEKKLSECFRAVKCSIETQDRILYAYREVGDLVDTGDFILNTSLYYAFGFITGKYFHFSNRPSYILDSSATYNKFYITPARPEPLDEYIKRFMLVNRSRTDPMPHMGGHSTNFWNARPHHYAVKNVKAADQPKDVRGKNIPKFGKERVLNQQNLFTAYILPYEIDVESLASMIPRYIRLGKKRSKARVITTIVEGKIDEGEFLSNHPFGLYDYEGVPMADLISMRMRPVPLILQGRYYGKYICLPSKDEDIVLPYRLEFLKMKRKKGRGNDL